MRPRDWCIAYAIAATAGVAAGNVWGTRFGLLAAGTVLLGFALVAKARRARSERN